MLEQARGEGWRALALIGPSARAPSRDGTAPEAQTFHLHEPLGPQVSRLASLTGLSCLDLRGNNIGAEGARALTALGGLTTLDLSGNPLGDDGVRALAALIALTSLDVSSNRNRPRSQR